MSAAPRATASDRALLGFLADHRKGLMALTHELIATPSLNPPGDERAVVAVLARHAASLGLGEGTVVALDPRRPNIVFRVAGAAPGPTLLLTGHTDTKPVGSGTEGLWATPPLEPVVREGQLYGLGSADMKAALAAMLYAAAALRAGDAPFVGELLVAFTADEEAGSRFGAGHLAREGSIRADAALLGEPCGVQRDWEHLCLASRRAFGFRTRVAGTQTHSSLSDRLPVVNAVQRAAEVLLEMKRGLRLNVPPHPLYEPAVTYNIGVRFEGGVYYGVVPGEAVFLSDIRLPPNADIGDVAGQVRGFVQGLRDADPALDIAIEQDLPRPEAPPLPRFEMPADHPLVTALGDAAEIVLGARPPFGGMAGGTDASQWHGVAGIPTIPAFGPGVLPVCHGPNEHVSVRAIAEAADMYALGAWRYLGDGSGA